MRLAFVVVGGFVALLALAVAAMAAIGALLPRQHTTTRSIVVRRPIGDVRALVRDVASTPTWRSDVARVETIDATHFREHSRRGAVTYEIVDDAPDRFVTRIADRDLGYGGSWTYRFAPDGDATRVTITEDGDVSNVVFRFLSRFVFSNAASIERCLEALRRRLDDARTAS